MFCGQVFSPTVFLFACCGRVVSRDVLFVCNYVTQFSRNGFASFRLWAGLASDIHTSNIVRLMYFHSGQGVRASLFPTW